MRSSICMDYFTTIKNVMTTLYCIFSRKNVTDKGKREVLLTIKCAPGGLSTLYVQNREIFFDYGETHLLLGPLLKQNDLSIRSTQSKITIECNERIYKIAKPIYPPVEGNDITFSFCGATNYIFSDMEIE